MSRLFQLLGWRCSRAHSPVPVTEAGLIDAPPGQSGILEEIADGSLPEPVPPTLPAMLRRVVEEVATLTERSEVGARIVAGIMVEMRTSEHDLGCPNR
ncbi:hypothetical protein [Sphingomonas sp. NPDC079357]|uniref:hypothetical protein n=1 Tax=Sphingomonas sp. NPDC079357 TaxID=3364518 RepID=UPI00384B2A9D